jgi:hypothetical protein
LELATLGCFGAVLVGVLSEEFIVKRASNKRIQHGAVVERDYLVVDKRLHVKIVEEDIVVFGEGDATSLVRGATYGVAWIGVPHRVVVGDDKIHRFIALSVALLYETGVGTRGWEHVFGLKEFPKAEVTLADMGGKDGREIIVRTRSTCKTACGSVRGTEEFIWVHVVAARKTVREDEPVPSADTWCGCVGAKGRVTEERFLVRRHKVESLAVQQDKDVACIQVLEVLERSASVMEGSFQNRACHVLSNVEMHLKACSRFRRQRGGMKVEARWESWAAAGVETRTRHQSAGGTIHRKGGFCEVVEVEIGDTL